MTWFGQWERRKKTVQPQSTPSLYIDIHPLCQWLNQPVFAISDKISDPYIGYGLKVINYDQNPFLVIQDYLSGQERIINRAVYPYSDALLRQYYNTDLRLLIALLYHRPDLLTQVVEDKLQYCYEFIDTVKRLEASGFYTRYRGATDGH